MYKFLTYILVLCLLVLGGFYVFERISHDSTLSSLNNQIGQLQGTIQENERIYSSQVQMLKNLKLQNDELKKIIKSRDEEIVSLGEVVLTWKGKYFDIVNATQSTQDGNGTPTTPTETCEECFAQHRLRVDFDQTQDYLRVFGHTLTSPPYAHVGVEWVRDVRLSLVLTRNKDKYRVYVDTDNSDVFPSEINLSIDSSAFGRKWYEKLGVGADLLVGHGVGTSLKLAVDIFNDMSLGPVFTKIYDGKDFRKYYGASLMWYPFR
jgi:hypothetical protein